MDTDGNLWQFIKVHDNHDNSWQTWKFLKKNLWFITIQCNSWLLKTIHDYSWQYITNHDS